MNSQILTNFTLPFPFTRGLKVEFLSALRSCILVTLILIFVRPFGLSDTSLSNLLGFGLVVLLAASFNILVSLFVLRRIVDEENWTVWKEISRTIAYLSVIVIAIVIYAQYYLIIEINETIVLKFIGFTIFFATIPISIRTISVHNWLLRKRLEEAKQLEEVIEENTSSIRNEESIILQSNIVNDKLVSTNDNLLYIAAEKNYITVVESIDGKERKTLLRLSLRKAEEQIKSDIVIRCHRSYLINLSKVSSVSGNSQGLKLIFPQSSFKVPVSRSFKEEVMDRIQTFFKSQKALD